MISEKLAHDLLWEESMQSTEIAENCRRLWSIILAGGNGDRMRDLILRWIGRPIPKQYCAFTGTRSMLQHTIQRAEMLSSRERQLIVIGETHKREAELQFAHRWPKGVILQPSNRDTLPGIFLPLTHVYARDAKATVAIYPSDHFIYPEKSFAQVMARAVRAIEEMTHMLLLIGVPADSLELDYGWICPGRQVWASGEHSVLSVKQFLEKPSDAGAVAAMACGGMWNTLIIVAKVQTLWDLGCSYFPSIMRHFERLLNMIGTSREKSTLESIYELMPARNFSSDLLTQAIDQIGVLPMKGVLWSDWGRMERVLETLHHLGKKPNFPMIVAANGRQTKQDLEIPLQHDEKITVARLTAELGSIRHRNLETA